MTFDNPLVSWMHSAAGRAYAASLRAVAAVAERYGAALGREARDTLVTISWGTTHPNQVAALYRGGLAACRRLQPAGGADADLAAAGGFLEGALANR